jgi:hypothetical protein
MTRLALPRGITDDTSIELVQSPLGTLQSKS